MEGVAKTTRPLLQAVELRKTLQQGPTTPQRWDVRAIPVFGPYGHVAGGGISSVALEARAEKVRWGYS